MTGRETTETDAKPKSTLFCPECRYRSGYDGDWQRVDAADGVHYGCPECGTEIMVRPGESSPASDWVLIRLRQFGTAGSISRTATARTRICTASLR